MIHLFTRQRDDGVYAWRSGMHTARVPVCDHRVLTTLNGNVPHRVISKFHNEKMIGGRRVPGSGTGQDGAVQQAEGQRARPAHRQDDGVQGGQDVALSVVGLQGLGQLGQRRHILDRGTASCEDGGEDGGQGL